MNKSIRFFLTCGAVGPLLLLCFGCSPHARKARALDRANGYFAAGRLDAAEIEYLNVLQIDRLNPQAIGRLGIIYFDEGRFGKSLPCLTEAARLQPDNRDVRLKLGLLFLAVGKFQEAAEGANFILARNPSDRDAPLLLAEAAIQPKEIEDARRRLERLAVPPAERAPVLVALGTLEFRQRHFPAAQDRLSQALALEPKSSDAYTALGALHWAENEMPEADRAFAEAAVLAPASPAKRLQHAEFKIQSGDRAAARVILEGIGRDRPDFLPAGLLLAELDETEKKYNDCAALVTKVLNADPTNADASLLLGRLKLATGKPDEAVTVFEAARKFYPHYPRLEYELARAYLAAGATEKAANCLNWAATWDPDFVEAVVLLAQIDIKTGNAGAASALLQSFIRRHPQAPSALFLLANAAIAQNNLDEALAVYRRLAAVLPRDPKPVLFSGMVLLSQGKREEARQDFDRALALAPDDLPTLTQEVNLDLAEKRFETARRRVANQVARFPALAEPHILLGRIFLAERDWVQAEGALRDAIRLQPHSPTAYVALAELFTATNQDGKALGVLREIVAADPKDIQALMLIGLIESRQKDFPSARKTYETILGIDANFSPALNNLAYLYAEDPGQLDRALEMAQRARKILPNEPRVADTLGWILYQRHQYPWALALLKESADRLPADAEIEFHLGMVHYMLGEESAARIALQRSVQSAGDFADRSEAGLHLSALAINPGTAGPDERALLEKAAANRPDDPIVLSRLAAIYERAGAADKAIGIWEAALRSNARSPVALVSLAQLYAARNDTAKAFGLAKSARDLAPDDPRIAHILGHLAYEMHDYRWAVSLLKEAADRLPNDPEAQYDLARADYSVGRVAEAKAAMQAVLKIDARYARAGEAKSFLDLVEAAAHPSQAEASRVEGILGRNPGDVPALMAMGAIDEQGGRSLAARRLYEKALALYPDFSPAQRSFVIISAETPGDDRKAFEMGTKARESFPGDSRLARAYGIIGYRQGDYRTAVSALEEGARQVGDDGELVFYLGMAQYRLKQRSSRATLERAISLNLRPDLAAEARRTLAELK